VGVDVGWCDADLVFLASEVGAKTPAWTIGRPAVERAGVAPTACLFGTDALWEAVAAHQTGMRAARVAMPRDM
jgi:hypothetical protein